MKVIKQHLFESAYVGEDKRSLLMEYIRNRQTTNL
jgi:hypothetical protein